jgi:hypothetical protein
MVHITFWFMLMMLIFGGGSVHTIKNTVALVAAGKEIGLEVNADKAKYMAMSRDQNAGRNHNIKTDNRTTLTNPGSNQEEIKSTVKSGNACCHSVHYLLFSSLLSKNTMI